MSVYTDIEREIDRGTGSGMVRDFLAASLAELADGRRRLSAVRHPLGFVCLPVVRNGDEGICVHAWLAGRRTPPPTTSTMHSHSWHLLSHVAHGQVRNEIIELTDPGDPVYRVYEVRSSGDIDELRATPLLVSPLRRVTRTHRAGESYRLPAGRFHRTDVDPGQTTVTVALARTAVDLCDLSLGAVDGRDHHIRRQRCDPAETARIATRIADLVAGGHGPTADGAHDGDWTGDWTSDWTAG